MKKRKFSLILNVVAICLSICAIAIGVYSIKSAKLGISGSVGFVAHNCNVDVTGYIYGHASGNVSDGAPVSLENAETLNSGNTLQIRGTNMSLSFGDRYFSDSTGTGIPEDIKIVLTITNASDYNILLDGEVTTTASVDILCPNNFVVLYTDEGDKSVTLTYILRLKPDSTGTYKTLTNAVNLNLSINFSKVPDGISKDGFTISGETITGIPEATSDNKTLFIPSTFSDGTNVTTLDTNLLSNAQYDNVVILKGITTYKEYLFMNNTSIKKITMSNTVVNLGQQTFSGCTNLNTVVLSKKLGDIPYATFYKTQSLKTVTIPNTLKKIQGFAFSYGGITDLSIPDSVEMIGGSAFYNSSITNITLGNGIKTLESAFGRCKNLKSINLNNVEEIKPGAFSECTNIVSVSFSNAIHTIGKRAFYSCTSLKSIDLSSATNLSLIDESAFACYAYDKESMSLQTCLLPENSTIDLTIGAGAFRTCKLKEIKIPKCVISIGLEAFQKNEKLTKVVFEDGSNNITLGEGIFSTCEILSSVQLSNRIKALPDSMFYGDISLINLTLPASINNLGSSVFYQTGIVSLDLSRTSITIVPSSAFVSTKIQTITLPKTVTEIGYNAFHSVPLKEIDLSGLTALKKIGQRAFAKCSNLTKAILPQNSTTGLYIEQCAFLEASIKSITIPSNVTNIGTGAFSYSALQSVTFASGTGSITFGMDVFHTCKNLSSVTFSNRVTTLPQSMFYACDSLISIEIPASVTTLGIKLFRKCANLKNVTFATGTTITTFSSQLFSTCTSLTSVTVPASVTKIEATAFEECSALTGVTFADTTKNWTANSNSLSVTSPATNATNLVTKYVAYAWTKNS